MKRILRLGLAPLALGLALAGCIGGGNPQDSHDTTRSPTNNQTMTTDATQTQTHNRNTCVGLVNVASCNTIQQANPAEAGGAGQEENPADSGARGVPLAQSAGVLCAGAPIVLLFMGLTVFGLLFVGGSRQ